MGARPAHGRAAFASARRLRIKDTTGPPAQQLGRVKFFSRGDVGDSGRDADEQLRGARMCR